MSYAEKNMKNIIFSYIVINLTIALIIIIILLTVIKPKKYPEFYVPDVKIECLESFYFIYFAIDYPYDNLGLTGNNAIYLCKGKQYLPINTINYTYLENAFLKDEKCPDEKSKYCGIIDDDGNKLCINSKYECPINYISKNYTENSSSVMIGHKTFYYGNDNTQNDRKIIAGLLADTDLYLNEDLNKTEILDTYTISGFLKDNKNLYKNINLEYDPYEEKDIYKKEIVI